jgi:hypothetical protein
VKVRAKPLAISDRQLLERMYEGAIAEYKLPAKQHPTLWADLGRNRQMISA